MELCSNRAIKAWIHQPLINIFVSKILICLKEADIEFVFLSGSFARSPILSHLLKIEVNAGTMSLFAFGEYLKFIYNLKIIGYNSEWTIEYWTRNIHCLSRMNHNAFVPRLSIEMEMEKWVLIFSSIKKLIWKVRIHLFLLHIFFLLLRSYCWVSFVFKWDWMIYVQEEKNGIFTTHNIN